MRSEPILENLAGMGSWMKPLQKFNVLNSAEVLNKEMVRTQAMVVEAVDSVVRYCCFLNSSAWASTKAYYQQ